MIGHWSQLLHGDIFSLTTAKYQPDIVRKSRPHFLRKSQQHIISSTFLAPLGALGGVVFLDRSKPSKPSQANTELELNVLNCFK